MVASIRLVIRGVIASADERQMNEIFLASIADNPARQLQVPGSFTLARKRARSLDAFELRVS
jgi:hypothetical protein